FHQSRRRVAPTGVPHDAAHQRSGRSGSSSGRPAAASPNRPSWLSLPSSRSVTRSMGSTPPQRAQIRSLKRAADHTLCGELQNRTIRALQARCSHRRHSIEACFSDSKAFVAPQCFKFGARPPAADRLRTDPHPTVLIASHEESSSRSLESILVPNGYTVLKAYTAAQTLERARESRPDAIILDATLREQGPLEICRTLRHDPEFASDTPIVI